VEAQLKLHKPHIPIRPVINNIQAQTYKVAKHLTKILDNFLTLNNYYNVTNSADLATVLVKLHVNENHRLMAFDIQDLFFNIPTQETLQITKSLLLKNNTPKVAQQIIELLRLILSQNYFTHQDKIYQPQKGITMRSPISRIMAEILLQHLKEQCIKQLLDCRNIIFYTRYVDDILIIYDSNKIQPKLIETHTNQILSNIKLNPPKEENGNINFLDLNINRKPTHLEIVIYNLPLTTQLSISNPTTP
jgi:hypothetical protein